LTALERLQLSDNEVQNINPLSGLSSIRFLDLDGNQISDIAPLAGLTALESANLDDNLIADFRPLVDNRGLAEGDRVTVKGNPLSFEAYHFQIPALQAQGVKVSYDRRYGRDPLGASESRQTVSKPHGPDSDAGGLNDGEEHNETWRTR